MANTIQIKRGPFASLPTLAAGEFALCTDTTKRLFIGDGAVNHEIATKEYVDQALDAFESSLNGGGASTFVELTDTPANYTDAGLKIVRVNSEATGLEFVSFVSTYLESSPTNGETNKAPTSDWAYDHNAASTGVHGAGANTLLHSGSVIDGGGFA